MRDSAMSGPTAATTVPAPIVTAPTDGRLELRWVPVTDERGRTHMEACWITVRPHHSISAA